MKGRRTGATALAAALWACGVEGREKPDPCDEGIFVDADGNAFPDATAAIASAVLLDGVVDVCPGQHGIDGVFGTTDEWEPEWPELVLRGAGREETEVFSTGTALDVGVDLRNGNAIKYGAGLTVESLTIGAAGGRYGQCVSDTDAGFECDEKDEFYEGALAASVYPWDNVLFRDVAFVGSRGTVAAAFILGTAGVEGYHRTTLEDCFVHNNDSSVAGMGAAALFDSGGDIRFATLTSINTDWGEGETDNSPADVAFEVWAPGATEPDTSNNYSWDGVADFVCQAETRSCE